MRLEPYLYFNGRTEEALVFYQHAINAETLSVLRFKDSPDGVTTTPEWQHKIMHSTFRIGASIIMASDGVNSAPQVFSGFSIAIVADDDASGQRMFEALSVDGNVRMTWQPTFWSSGFGMVSDKFGIPWIVSVMDDLGG
ncbi:3-demethylubiquinone-9 3-methyltransferase [Caballeronia sordidicola]|uniref:3-demethylubiquinone-9 3-methyltransferase n=1 Tax=Caballeronia sordidicola TaxID=196367 RepID=A0A158F0B1_CABSO|nr:VOC family protein [Caballeronia sordidicola]SAL12440.1 3-demethylubiquinone-9 3-methyltransferase [Caballeronia sordidicola]